MKGSFEMSKNGSSKAKKLIIIIPVVLVALVALVLVTARFYFRVPVMAYYNASEKAFEIPGLSDNLVPQGLDYDPNSGTYLVGGYQKDGSPSRVYRVDKQSGKSDGYVVLGDENGNGVSPHAGGLAINGDFLFVAGDEDAGIYVYRLSEVLSAKSGDVLKRITCFRTLFGQDKLNVAFLFFTNEGLIVGEFYRVPNYMTPDTHVFKTQMGEDNHALALLYRFSNDGTAVCGLETQPSKAYSLPGLVQGMLIQDGMIWVSQSYGTAQSVIGAYKVDEESKVGTLPTLHGDIPVYSLDSWNLKWSIDAPPMSEEIIYVDGKLLIMCESASNKYFFGNLTGGRYCYATDVSKLI